MRPSQSGLYSCQNALNGRVSESAGNEREEAPVLITSTITTGAAGALAMPACGTEGLRERLTKAIGAVAACPFAIRSAVYGGNDVDAPTSEYVRPGGAHG